MWQSVRAGEGGFVGADGGIEGLRPNEGKEWAGLGRGFLKTFFRVWRVENGALGQYNHSLDVNKVKIVVKKVAKLKPNVIGNNQTRIK